MSEVPVRRLGTRKTGADHLADVVSDQAAARHSSHTSLRGFMGWGKRFLAPPVPQDPRYRVLERRDVREAVRVEIRLVVLVMLVNLAVVGSVWTWTDLLAAIAVGVFAAILWGPVPLVQRRPYASALIVGYVLLTVLATSLIELPQYSSLLFGDYAVIIVGSALLVTLNERAHRLWLIGAAVPLIVSLSFVSRAPLSASRHSRPAWPAIRSCSGAASGTGNRRRGYGARSASWLSRSPGLSPPWPRSQRSKACCPSAPTASGSATRATSGS